MNKIYRLVWNPSLRIWVAVSELTKAKGKGKAGRTATVAGAIILSLSPLQDAQAYLAGGGNDNGGSTNIAIGSSAVSAGTSSTAMGTSANSSGYYTIAIGDHATAQTTGADRAGAIALGMETVANFDGATAIGSNSQATQLNTVAIGRAAIASGVSAVAIGDEAQANGNHSTTIGGGSIANGDTSTSVGWYAISTGANALSFGNYATSSGLNSVSIGTNTNASGGNSIALGSQSISSGLDSLALGLQSNALNEGSTAIGLGALASSSDATQKWQIAVGPNAKSVANSSMAMGNAAQALSQNSVALGAGAISGIDETGGPITVSETVAIGRNAKSLSTQSVVIGASATAAASTAHSVVVGDGATSTGASATALGSGAQAVMGASTLGYQTKASAFHSIAIGEQASVNNSGSQSSIAIGQNASIGSSTAGQASMLAVALGSGANVAGKASGALALGSGSSATVTSGVALGQNAVANRSGLNGASELFSNAVVASNSGAVSVGNTGGERQIINVAGGTQATDAVNVRQLQAVSDGSVKYDKNPDDTVNYNSVTMGGPTYNTTTKTGGTKITNVADGTAPSDAVNFSQLTDTNNTVNNIYATGTKYFHANSTGTDSVASGVDAVAIGMGAIANVARSVALGDGAQTQAAVATTGTTIAGTNYAFAGTAPVGTVSIGKAGEERTLTNVAAGQITATSTDGINGSQLFATNSAINALDQNAVKYDLNGDGTVNYNSVTMGGPAYNSITKTGGTKITNVANGTAPSDAVNFSQLTDTNNTVNNIYATGTKYFHANSTGTDSVASGTDAVAIGMGAIANVARSVALGDGSQTQAPVATTGTTILGKNYTFAGTAPVGTVSIGKAGEERTLTNVAAGQITATSTDGINGSQLFASNSAINSAINQLDQGSVKYDLNGDGTVNYNSVTMGGPVYNSTTKTGGTKITNVADGTAPSDAVNFSQLTDTNNTVNNIYATGTKYFHANSTGTDSVASGIDAVAIGMGAIADVARSVALGDGSQTQAAVATTGTTIAGTNYAFAGTAPVGTVSIGKAGEERTLTNVAAGQITATSTDGINGSQLFATNSAINALDQNAVKYDLNGDGTVNYNSVTMGGPAYNSVTKTGGTKITNVANGTAPSDAVNFSQLTDTNSNVTNLGDTINNIAGDTSTAYTDVHGEGIRYVRTNEAGLVQSDSSAEGQGSTAVGYNALSTGNSSLALGREAQAKNADDVALGSGSVTDIAVGTSGTNIDGVDYVFAGVNPLSTVSVGSLGHERTITNVAAGRLSADSTDAINGSQLFATNTAINTLDQGAVKYKQNADGTVDYNTVVMGGNAGATYNTTTKAGGTHITNVAYGIDASDAVNVQQLTDATTSIYDNGVKYFHANSAKADSVASGTDSIAVGPNAQSVGNSSIAMGDEAKSTGNGSMAMGQNSQAVGENSVAMGAGSVATNAGDIALGAGSVSAAAVATTGTTIAGNHYDFAGTAPTSTLSIGSEGNERTITNVAAGRISADSTDAVNGSELYATNKAIENISGDVGALDKGAVKYETNTDGTVNYNKVVMGGDTYNNSTNTGGTTIANVADGVAPSDAVNKHQLDVVNNNVTNIANGTDGMFQVNNSSNLPKPRPTGQDAIAAGAGAAASGDNSVAIGTNAKATHKNAVALGNNSVTDRDNSVSMGYAGGERQVTNVAAGTQGTDAVNVNQLKDGIGNSYKYTDNKFNDLKNMVDNQSDKLSAGISGAMAMASLPQPYLPGASMVGLAGGTYQGQSAVALGVSTISDNGKWVTKISGTTTSKGDLGAAVGVGYQW